VNERKTNQTYGLRGLPILTIFLELLLPGLDIEEPLGICIPMLWGLICKTTGYLTQMADKALLAIHDKSSLTFHGLQFTFSGDP
jgi:hypothetical protein